MSDRGCRGRLRTYFRPEGTDGGFRDTLVRGCVERSLERVTRIRYTRASRYVSPPESQGGRVGHERTGKETKSKMTGGVDLWSRTPGRGV